ncbi:hypothetical protein IMX07_14725 [bacterium]|nr:hypothetical protein [bacterium]
MASPDRQWKRKFSAYETAVSWETASKTDSGLPAEIVKLLRKGDYADPILMIAVAEHKVPLPGGNADSQSDVWAIVKTSQGMLSLTVEAKAREVFGNEILEKWFTAGRTEESEANRRKRWEYIQKFLPNTGSYSNVRYQLLHRCAAAVIEAERFGFNHAAFVVQAFEAPKKRFADYATFCAAMKLPAEPETMATTVVGKISLSVGWADCACATDGEIAAIA